MLSTLTQQRRAVSLEEACDVELRCLQGLRWRLGPYYDLPSAAAAAAAAAGVEVPAAGGGSGWLGDAELEQLFGRC